MISRSLSRYDEEFIRSALSAQERTAALEKLRHYRWLGALAGVFLLFVLGLGGIVDIVQHRPIDPPSFLVLALAFCMVFQMDLASQIRLLEIMQRLGLSVPTEPLQEAEPPINPPPG
jgi:hypothetical protein